MKIVKISRFFKKADYWELTFAFKIYIIFFLFVLPVVYLYLMVNYLSILVFLGIGWLILLILKYLLISPRITSKTFCKMCFIVSSIIIINFIFSLIINIIRFNVKWIILSIIIILGSIIYFVLIFKIEPYKKLKIALNAKITQWSKKRLLKYSRNGIYKKALILWLLFSFSLILFPYPTYFQKYFKSSTIIQQNPLPKTHFGIWTYGQNLDDDKIDDDIYIDNETLEMLGEAGVYFIYGINKNNLHLDLVNRLNRCKKFGVEIHLCIGPLKFSYANIWSFNSFKDEIEDVLSYLSYYNLTGDPITYLVYDMETLTDTPFPFYGFMPENFVRLNKYDKTQQDFIDFNEKIMEKYDLEIKITTDYVQAMDYNDGDDDLISLYGLMDIKKAKMSYMVYRRDTFGRNEIFDHCKILKDGDTIILNAWKYPGYLCWKDVGCAIFDCRLVLGYPNKSFRLEIWELGHFITSFGIEGLKELVKAICDTDSSEWPLIIVWNEFPYSIYWDTVFIGVIILDLYSPLFRLLFNAY